MCVSEVSWLLALSGVTELLEADKVDARRVGDSSLTGEELSPEELLNHELPQENKPAEGTQPIKKGKNECSPGQQYASYSALVLSAVVLGATLRTPGRLPPQSGRGRRTLPSDNQPGAQLSRPALQARWSCPTVASCPPRDTQRSEADARDNRPATAEWKTSPGERRHGQGFLAALHVGFDVIILIVVLKERTPDASPQEVGGLAEGAGLEGEHTGEDGAARQSLLYGRMCDPTHQFKKEKGENLPEPKESSNIRDKRTCGPAAHGLSPILDLQREIRGGNRVRLEKRLRTRSQLIVRDGERSDRDPKRAHRRGWQSYTAAQR
ncbi:hypothetical protein EYF80_021997 [Liparis tanakae]|uniref:Uncharacterized protein n=1 Tax=Liparis tanakae TaxID=230148 RepID=A0A4Z2HS79_9TELE|nr:hypothetical protein EYF80_021997 [Liparis tanakae]